MQKLALALLGTGALAIGAISGAAAADLKAPVRKAPVPVVAVYNWTGFYIGAHVGGAWGTEDWGIIEGEPGGSHNSSGFIGGGQIGFNWQAPGSNWVLGVEGQVSWADLEGDHKFRGENLARTNVNWLATVAGRLGYAWDRVLLYAKGGVAFVGDEHQAAELEDGAIDLFFNFVSDKTRTGWMAGGGIEIALGGNWTAKGEYNYMDFGTKSVMFSPVPPTNVPLGALDIEQQIHLVKFGINYRFGPSPVVARY